MEEEIRILNQFLEVEKTSIYGRAAEMCLNDINKARQFILECFEQTDLPNVKKRWGPSLIKNIVDYHNKHG